MEEAFIVIPARNEESHIAEVVEKARKISPNLVVVDDGSTDRTNKIASSLGVRVIRHIVNLGKGAALTTGTLYAISRGAERIVFIDADGQHDPADIPKFLEKLENCDIVLGSRDQKREMPLIFRFGNDFIGLFTYILFGIRVSDSQNGFRAFRSGIFEKIRWKSSDYSVESEMIAKIGKNNLRFKEQKIKTVYKDKFKGTTPFDGIKIVLNMIVWRMTR